MHHHGELARQRHLGLLHALPAGDPQRPGLERRAAHGAGQHHVGRLEQRRAHHGVAHLADPPGPIDLAGLVLLRRQAEVRAHGLGTREALGLVDRRPEGHRHHRADARNGHQPAAHRIRAHRLEQLAGAGLRIPRAARRAPAATPRRSVRAWPGQPRARGCGPRTCPCSPPPPSARSRAKCRACCSRRPAAWPPAACARSAGRESPEPSAP